MALTSRRLVVLLVAIAWGGGLFLLGRITNDTSHAQPDGYYSGLRQGESRGIQEGRALQLTESLPRAEREAVRTAFDTGYAAGANDAFGGYDGGWYVSRPYLVTLIRGNGPITYDLATRTMLHGGVDYYLCPHTHTVCQQPHD